MIIKSFSKPVFITILLILLLTTSVITTQTTAQNPYGNILTVDIDGEGDYTSIQSAINNATNGDTIKIKNGVYTENNIIVNKKIIIEGENQDKTIIDCSDESGFTIDTCCVEIKNLEIMNSEDYSIYILPNNNKCEITDVKIINAKNVGIWIQGPDAEIEDCVIQGLGEGVGIKIRDSETIIDQTTVYSFDTGLMLLINSDNHIIRDSIFYDNEKAIDIRINSDGNTVTNCDISYNTNGIYIWQNSKNNRVYLNNLWKNTVNAYSENQNFWDNGTLGNYWDDYESEESQDGKIGVNPYIINSNNQDNKPLLEPVYSTVLRKPVNVRKTSLLNDATPSFTWLPSLYSKDIKGYIVKIDNNQEIFIGNKTNWTLPNSVNNGLHTFYVKAQAVDDATSKYATVTFLIDTTTNDSDNDGWTDDEEEKYGTDPYDSDNYPLDTDDDSIPDSVDEDDDNDGYSDEMEESYGSFSKNSKSTPLDTDDDGIPNNDSLDGKFVGDLDDDNDGLNDIKEEKIGSNPINPSDAKKIYIKGKEYFLVDLNENNFYDILFNPENEKTYAVQKQNKNYLIDLNSDESWDYIYNTEIDEIEVYKEKTEYNILIIFGIITTTLTVLSVRYYLIYKKTNKPLKKQKKKTEKKVTVDNIDFQEKRLETVDVTKNLLYDMQKTVSKYVEQLDQIEKEIKKSEQKNNDKKNLISVKKVDKEKEIWKKELKKDSKINIETKVDSIIFEKMIDKKIDVSTMDVDNAVDTLLSKHFNNFKK